MQYQVIDIDVKNIATVKFTADNGYSETLKYSCSGGISVDGKHALLEAALRLFNSQAPSSTPASTTPVPPKFSPVIVV